MHVIKARVAKHLSTNSKLPKDILSLPLIPKKIDDVHDGWGRAITWSIENSQVTLTSYGKDGVVGGDGENADIIRVIHLETMDFMP